MSAPVIDNSPMMMRQLLVFAIVCWASAFAQDGDIYAADEYPNPFFDTQACGRGTQRSYICDPSFILKAEEAQQLEALLGIIRNETACPCADHYCNAAHPGYKIGIALVKKIAPSNPMKTGEDEKDPSFVIQQNLEKSSLFAYTLLKRWQMGACGEDVIILYSVVDNVFYTITGEVAEKKLTASMIGDISMNTREMFRPSTAFEGLLSLVKQYQAVFMGRYKQPDYRLTMPEAQAVRSHAGFVLPSLLALLMGLLVAVH
ncbi:hypothetical protein CAPTEDRAFT_218860 [Capitella teleta]|uniref:TPM domain-containing protein n=1 Tax=Capitella teleta TaxID=283909 RepID=R7TBF7_CAPTE|nr:hypothetical protein CAPTEDRAFT_218860 [Capitella teleta]|eukprot:ELT88349.1 hypothetical protein CAPTEDRAFT_218860 [Capitella teleta]